jgi:peptide/nickel transport system permease protein
MTHSATEIKIGSETLLRAPKRPVRLLPSRGMLKFIAFRLFMSVIALLVLVTVLHLYVGMLMPGDYVSQFYGMSVADKEEMRHDLGLDLPPVQQYFHWLGRVVRGDLGNSFRGAPVRMMIGWALPRTLLIFLTGLGIAFAVGYWLGKAVGWHGPGPLSDTATIAVLTMYAFFPPALAYILNFFLAQKWGLLPASLDLFWSEFELKFPTARADSIYASMVITLIVITLAVFVLLGLVRRITRRHIPGFVTALLIIFGWFAVWGVLGYAEPGLQLIRIAVVPIFAMTLLSMGDVMVISRASMVDTLHEQYVQTARAKGLRNNTIRDYHAGPNAFLPVLSKMVISLPYLLGGLSIIEYATGWPGIGGSIFVAAAEQDVPLMMGYLLMLGLLTLVCRLVLDILYAYLDPRIRFGSGN